MNPLEHAEGVGPKGGRTARAFSRMARYHRVVGFGLVTGTVTVLAALALPVPAPGSGTAGGGLDVWIGKDIPTLAPEDLSLFLDSRRWGGETLQEVRRRVAETEATAAKQRAIDKVRLLGLVKEKDRRAFLMQLPDGVILRLLPDDTLPDGRGVKTATDRTVTLEGNADGQTDVLALFPPLRQEPMSVGSDAEIQGPSVETDTMPAR